MECVTAPWGSYSNCSLFCGGGRKVRARSLLSPGRHSDRCRTTAIAECNTFTCCTIHRLFVYHSIFTCGERGVHYSEEYLLRERLDSFTLMLYSVSEPDRECDVRAKRLGELVLVLVLLRPRAPIKDSLRPLFCTSQPSSYRHHLISYLIICIVTLVVGVRFVVVHVFAFRGRKTTAPSWLHWKHALLLAVCPLFVTLIPYPSNFLSTRDIG